MAVFEILSPEDRMRRMLEKLDDFEKMGVQNVFVIDQQSRFLRYRQGALEPVASGRIDLEGHVGFIDFREALEKRSTYF